MSADRRSFMRMAATAVAGAVSLRGWAQEGPHGALPVPKGPLPMATPQRMAGLNFGVETFSFHDIPQGDPTQLPRILEHMQQAGIPECEIMSGHVEPFANALTGWWVQTR